MNLNSVLLLFLVAYSIPCLGKVVIFTYAFNRPDFIELQHKTFQKFLKNDYEFVVFSDAISDADQHGIELMCNKYELKCIRIPQAIHDMPYLERPSVGAFSQYHSTSVRNCNVVQYSLNEYGFKHDDILILIDSDMFLIKDLDVRDYMSGYDLVGVRTPCRAYPPHTCSISHPRVEPFEYLWIGLVFLNMATMPNKNTINFNCGKVFGNIRVDSGGYTAYYLKNNPTVKVREIDRRNLEYLVCNECKKLTKPAPACTHNLALLTQVGLDEKAIKFSQSMPIVGNHSKEGRPSEFLMNGTFLHYRGGTNYHNFSATYHNKKTQLFNVLINDLLQR